MKQKIIGLISIGLVGFLVCTYSKAESWTEHFWIDSNCVPYNISEHRHFLSCNNKGTIDITNKDCSYIQGIETYHRGECAQALKIFKLLAQRGYTKAQKQLDDMYSQSYSRSGVVRDEEKAKSYYEQSTKQGITNTRKIKNMIRINKLSKPLIPTNQKIKFKQAVEDYGQGNYNKAIILFEELAQLNNAAAQFNLAMLMPINNEVDRQKKRIYLEQAAMQGNAYAQNTLGIMYKKHGNGVPQDYVKACAYFEQAAKQGNAEAQYNLGVMYLEGLGVKQDYGKARIYFNQVTQQGYSYSRGLLREMDEKGL